jgi:dTDP-4-dehydrorhamnose reductase
MTTQAGYFVVGGDSLVGGETVRAMRARGLDTLATTRRRETLGEGRVLFDFEDEATQRAPEGVHTALVIAAATDYKRCEQDPQARVINVELIPKAVENLLAQGLFVVFISTNSLFGGEKPWPHEDDAHAPNIAYAQQKHEGELSIQAAAEQLGAQDRLNITRLTKVLTPEVPPLPSWFDAWDRGEAVTPFSDFIVAPVSVDYVARSLATIAQKRPSGNTHLSGAEDVTYTDIARALAERYGAPADLVQPTTATEKGVHIAFKPSFSGIGMTRTREITGVEPQPFAGMIDDIAAAAAKR